MLPDEGRDRVHTYLRGFFNEPFEPVVVLGRTAGYRETVRVTAPVRKAFQHFGLHPFRAVQGKPAAEKRPLAVDDMDIVPAAMTEHLDAVGRFFGVQAAVPAVRFTGIEQFHAANIGIFP